jgi:hypothetical protein
MGNHAHKPAGKAAAGSRSATAPWVARRTEKLGLEYPDPEERAMQCLRLAHATYDIAEECDDHDMLHAYLDLAGKWLGLADNALAEAPETH